MTQSSHPRNRFPASTAKRAYTYLPACRLPPHLVLIAVKRFTSPDFAKSKVVRAEPETADTLDKLASSETGKEVKAAKSELESGPQPVAKKPVAKKPVALGGEGVAIKKTADLANTDSDPNESTTKSSNEAKLVWIVLIVLLSVIVGLSIWLVYQDDRPEVEAGVTIETKGSTIS